MVEILRGGCHDAYADESFQQSRGLSMVSHLKFEAYDKRLTNVNVLFIILADSAIIFLFQFRL